MNRPVDPSGSPQQTDAPRPPRRRERVAWLDLFRGAAVLVMIETHVVNTFLATAVRAESWFTVLNYLNGLVAPSFLFIAGFVQGLERCAVPAKPVNFARRARRLLGLGAIGYALHFPWAELAQHRWDAAWRVGSQVDVLQCLAAALGLLLFVSWLAQKIGGRRGDRCWWTGALVLLTGTVLVAGAAAHWNPAAIPVRAWLNFSTGSWFPLFPWAGFVFAGALAGASSRRAESSEETAPSAAAAALLAIPGQSALARFRPATLAVTPLPLAISAWACRGLGYSPISPASFLERIAWVLALAALCQWLITRHQRPALVLFAGQHSLTLYVVHLVLISTLATHFLPTAAYPPGTVWGLLALVGGSSLLLTWALAQLRARLGVRTVRKTGDERRFRQSISI